MSHLIVRGNPAGGTGQTELKPAQTNTDHFLLVPAAGTHLSTGDSAGMPQLFDGTPIVESGGNTDGEWTRWADGTQVCSRSVTTGATSAIANRSWALPFIDVNYRVSFMAAVMPVAANIVNVKCVDKSLASAGYIGVTTTSGGSQTYFASTADITAKGRWK